MDRGRRRFSMKRGRRAAPLLGPLSSCRTSPAQPSPIALQSVKLNPRAIAPLFQR